MYTSYLSNRRGLSGSLKVAFPDGRPVLTFDRISAELGAAIQSGGYYIRPDGTPYSMSNVAGGDLLDGCPANVLSSDGVWTPAQLEAIAKDPALAAAVSACRYPWKPQAPLTQPALPVISPPLIQVTNAPTYSQGNGSGGGYGGYQAGPNTPIDTSTFPLAPTTTSTGTVTPRLYSPAEEAQEGTIGGPSLVAQAGVASPGIGMLLLVGAAIFFLSKSKKRR